MRGTYVLHLTPACLTAFSVGRDGVTTEHAFSHSAEGHRDFETFLSGLDGAARISLLVDVPDEAHHIESLPFVRGRDRRAMLSRRQDHLFGDTPFRSHLSLGRESDGRRDERILFAALTRPASIRPWLQRIVASPCILAEMTSTSFLSQALAIPLQPASKLFLLAHLTPAGLRVSCFENKRLRFSRLTVSSAPGPDSDTRFVVDEIRRSYDYLLSQRALPHNRPTVACILVADDAARDALQAAQFASPGLTLQPVLMAEASAALRLAPPGAGANSLPLLIQTFATRRPRLPQFAPTDALAGQRLQRQGRIAGALAATIFLICLGSAGLTLLEARGKRSLAENNLRQAAILEARLVDVIGKTPALPQPLEYLRLTLDMLQALAASNMGPEPALHRLAAALAPIRGFNLQEIEWSIAAPVAQPPAMRAATQTLRVRFDLPSGTDRARERAHQAHSILAALDTLAGAQIHILRQPAETSGSEPLRGAASLPGDTSPQLEVRIQLPLNPP
ncbi:hypothetical protein [Zoogloea sp.]|uniref:hypothetical protein n=1 Tax=Zoogloea sp. TaxID=49181 RepID=UPI0035B0D86E